MSVETQRDGWPVGVDDETKELLVKTIKELLTRHPKGLELWVIHSAVKSKLSFREWNRSPLLDHQFATIERAVRQAGALNVWRLPGPT